MKIRNGFVSNSSSSSFIIAIDLTKNNRCKCCGRTDPSIIEALDGRHAYSDDNNVNYRGWSYIVHNINSMEYCSQEWKDKILKKLESYKNEKKWEVLEITISYHDDVLMTMLENMIKAKTAVMVNDQEGRIVKDE